MFGKEIVPVQNDLEYTVLIWQL